MRAGSALAAAASRLRVFSLRELVVHRRRTLASIAVMAVSAMYLVAIFGIFGSISGSPTPDFPTRSRPTWPRFPVSRQRYR
jgi:putative ABC transport system permease protein